MKLKKQIFTLGAIAIIASPIVVVASCGAKIPTAPTPQKPVKKIVRAEKASLQGYSIALSATFHLYSDSLPKATDTFVFINESTQPTTTNVFTITSVDITNATLDLDLKIGNTSTHLLDKPYAHAVSGSVVLSDKSGSYYIPDLTTSAGLASTLSWVNYNKIITLTDTAESGATKITDILKGTGYHCGTITITTPGTVASISIVKDSLPIIPIIPTPAKKTVRVEKASATGYHIDLNTVFHIYSETLPKANDTFTFKDANQADIPIVFTAKAPTDNNTKIVLTKTTNGGTPILLPAFNLKRVTTKALIFSDKSGSYYIDTPLSNTDLIVHWVNYNKIVTGTNAVEGAKMVTTALKDTGYNCTSLAFKQDGTVASIVLALDTP